MKLCMSEDEGMLCEAAWRHMGRPEAVIVDRDAMTGETVLRAGAADDLDASLLEPVVRLGYSWAFAIDVPPLLPSGYRLHPNRDGSLTVDLTPCPT